MNLALRRNPLLIVLIALVAWTMLLWLIGWWAVLALLVGVAVVMGMALRS